MQVALAMKKKGQAAKVGDIIPYVICTGTGSGLAGRAFHADDYTAEGSELKVDFIWYLTNQVHPPVARLCAPIDGTDIARLANCLGLDVAKYQNVISSTAAAEELYTFESTIPLAERFKDVEKWAPRCMNCGECNEFRTLVSEKVRYFHTGYNNQQHVSVQQLYASASLRIAALSAASSSTQAHGSLPRPSCDL